MTITDTHLVLGAGLIGDFNPHHVDEEYARGSRFGTRVLHGVLTSAIMGAPVGMHFHGTAVAYLEHATRFKAPVRAGDTLTTTWTVSEMHPKPQQHAGVVVVTGDFIHHGFRHIPRAAAHVRRLAAPLGVFAQDRIRVAP